MTMSRLDVHVNKVSADLFGPLQSAATLRVERPVTPVLATPLAVAAGVTLTAAAFGGGLALGAANG
jgi:hypothetical protein